DGDTLSIVAQSSDENVVSAAINEAGVLVQLGSEPGRATVTVVVDDGREGRARTQLNVTVAAPNQDPTIAPIDNQQMTAGETRELGVNASDPDGDTLSIVAQSSDENAVSAAINEAGVLVLQANNPGQATVTVVVDDGREGSARTQLNVTVVAPNQDPIIAPIENQQMTAGETRELGVNASDPDGDPLSIVAQSSDENAVSAAINEAGVLV